MAYTDPLNWGTRVFPYVEDYAREFESDADVDPADMVTDSFMQVAGDMLADLFHLAAQYAVTPEQLAQRALRIFDEEVSEEVSR